MSLALCGEAIELNNVIRETSSKIITISVIAYWISAGGVRFAKFRPSNNPKATKSLKPNAKLKPDEIEVLKRRWIQEYNWMKSLDIPFIVGAIEIDDKEFLHYLQEQNQWKMLPVIVMEYCNGGDLRSVLERVENVNGLPEKDIRDILLTLRHAVEYLHQHCNIEHRDIKPENIVINHIGDAKSYKLTDFGYAREIPEHTIAQSVVGTCHYVAPEVIESGSYTKTVDYWSIGVLAFEIICGIRPFIPHRDFSVILKNILSKPKKCIAIMQCIDDPEADRFCFEEKIIRQNKCNPIFNENIEKWLSLALDKEYKQRGVENGGLKFYSKLDEILESSILSVYSISGCKFLYYDINDFKDIHIFHRKLSKDSTIPLDKIYLILPTSHPKTFLSNIRVPEDYFVSEWLDPHNPDNPPAMLYVANIEQCDCNMNTKEIFQTVPKVISICINTDPANYERVPLWLIDQFERQLHYLLSEQQRYVECHMRTLFEYIFSIEHEVFLYDAEIKKVHEYSIMLSGRVRQFVRTVQKYAELSGAENTKLIKKADVFSKDCDILKEEVASKILIRYKSVYSRCKALSSKDIYNSLPQKDIFKLKDFRRYLSEVQSHKLSNSKRMKECVKAFDTWAGELTKLSHNVEIKEIHNQIYTQYDIFRKINGAVVGLRTYIEEQEKKLDQETSNLLQLNSYNDQISMKMNSLSIDRNQSDFLWKTNGDACNSSASKLMEDANNLLFSIQSVMDIDDVNDMCVEIPTTVKDI